MEEDVILEILLVSVPVIEYDAEIDEIRRENYPDWEFITMMRRIILRRMIYGSRVFN